MFEAILSDEFSESFRKLLRKNKVLALAVNRKIKEIISRDKKTVQFYKNLKGLHLKRVHITETLVIIFEVDLGKSEIVFTKLGHRDSIYKELEDLPKQGA